LPSSESLLLPSPATPKPGNYIVTTPVSVLGGRKAQLVLTPAPPSTPVSSKTAVARLTTATPTIVQVAQPTAVAASAAVTATIAAVATASAAPQPTTPVRQTVQQVVVAAAPVAAPTAAPAVAGAAPAAAPAKKGLSLTVIFMSKIQICLEKLHINDVQYLFGNFELQWQNSTM
jgi:hypothetical protein